MTPEATRLRSTGLAVLLVTAVLVWTVQLRAGRWEPAAHPEKIVMASEIPGTKTVHEKKTKKKDRVIFDRYIGELETPTGAASYQILRSDQPSELTWSWVLKLDRPLDPLDSWGESREVDGESIVVHWVEESIGSTKHFAASTEVLGCEPVQSLLASQIQSAPRQLLHGSLPLTVYVVEATVSRIEEEAVKQVASEWLGAAVSHHREVCSS